MASTPRRQDEWDSRINDVPLSSYFYFMNLDTSSGLEYSGKLYENLIPFTNSGVVLSLLYAPFLSPDDFNLYKIPYDNKHFGFVNPHDPFPVNEVNVFRIAGNFNIPHKQLGHIPRYPFQVKPSEAKKDWRNESKLWQFPYHFMTINDYINTPLVLRNDLIPSRYKQQIPITASQTITMSGGYTVYVDGYKGDSNRGANEGMLASAGLDLPTASNQYAQFMASSKAQFIAQQESSSRNEWNNFGRGAISTVTGAFQAGLGAIAIAGSSGTATMMGAGSMIGAGVMTMGQGIMDMIQSNTTTQNRVEQAVALHDDLKSAPRSVTMTSADILLSLSRNQNALYMNRYTITEHYKKKLADYWTLYGYKQNKLMKPDLKSRTRFNYIKTLQANIDGYNMDKNELQMIKEIFNSGIRFWHITTGEEKMHDYSLDNKEVHYA